MRGVIQRRLTTLLFVLVLGLPSILLAQVPEENVRNRDPVLESEKSITSELQRATVHHGAWYLLSSLQLADIGYDQQFYAPTTEQTNSLSFGLAAPQKLFYVVSKKTIFDVGVTPSYAFVNVGGRHNQLGYNALAEGHLLLNHMYLNVYGTHADQLEANTGELNSLLTVRSTEIGTRGEIKYSSRTSATFSAAVRQIRHPLTRLQPLDIPVEELDRDERNYRVSLVHKTFPLTSLFVAGEESDYTFQVARNKDSQKNYAAVGALYDNGVTSARLEAGYAQLQFDEVGQKNFRGVLGNLTAHRSTASRWDFSALGSRDVVFSIFSGNNYYISDRGSLEADYQATRRLTLRALTQAGRDVYDVATIAPNGLFIRRRDTIEYNAVGFIYSLKRFHGGFDIGYYKRDSNADIDDQNGIRLVLHLSLNP